MIRRFGVHCINFLAGLLCSVAVARYAGADDSVTGVPWPATDALGRSLPTPQEVGPLRKDRFVGIFYFINHDAIVPQRGGESPPDISRILAEDPLALRHPDSPLWGPYGSAHYWGEPLYGYYRSSDPWVLRRHAELLSAAGIDTLIFDTTNAETYPQTYLALCEVFTAYRKAGGTPPRIAFMVNTKAGQTAEALYQRLYKPGSYRDLWFMWQGKPLLICDPKEATPELRNFFTLRAAHWPFELVNTPYAWHWESTYPQVYGYTDDPARPEEVNVAVAQNLRAADGKVTNMSEGNARGRSFHDGIEDRSPGAINHGYNFAEQWKRALELGPPFVMVTGWNEWVAGRFKRPGNPNVFVDQYDEEFSRDIEPMKGGHGDNYYYQLVANVRRYKGVTPPPQASAPRHISIDGNFSAWTDVAPEYTEVAGNESPRNENGAGRMRYSTPAPRYNLTAFKVARDENNLYFYARSSSPITASTDPAWMWLMIDIDGKAATGWEGFDFIVNRSVDPDGSSWLEKNIGGWKGEKVAKIQSRAVGNELELAIPRKALGLPEGAAGVDFNFKWTDNLQHPGDVMDFYLSGSVAPKGRFMYRYETQGHR